MKKTLFLMCAITMALTASAQKCHIYGTIDGIGDSILVYRIDANTMKQVASPEKKASSNNSFDFNYDLKGAENIYIISMKNGKPNQSGVQIQVPALPGEEAKISGNSESYHFDGSQFYKDYESATMAFESSMEALNEFQQECSKMQQEGVNQDSITKIYNDKSFVLKKSITDDALAYIKANPDKEASAAILTMAGDNIEDNAKILTSEIRNGRASGFYKGELEEMKEQQEMHKKQASLEGKTAPDFTLKDINGKPLTLSSLRGKYVLLDFWGSWCVWCIKGMPQMKEYYNKYKGKFEILGIDCNDTELKWKEAVKKHELPWLHVFNPKENANNPCESYVIQGFPTKILVDPQGKIAKVVVGEDPTFYTYMDELFK